MIHTYKIYLLMCLVACTHQSITKDNIENIKGHEIINEIEKMCLSVEYEPSVCAPKFYPIEVYRGDFYTDDDWVSIPNGGIVEDGWGDNSKNMGEGKLIPTGFKITYFSYLENKFYTGDFKLPADSISHLFKEGFIDYMTKKQETYDAIIVGMAPGGVLVVWMQGYDKQVEICRYQAIETTMEWEAFKRNTGYTREEFLKRTIDHRTETVANFEKNGLMLGLWDTYRIKYSWRPKFEFPEGCVAETIRLKMYNGEYELLWGDALVKNIFEKRALTYKAHTLWEDESGQKYGAHIDFDEAEIFEVYKLIYRDDKEQNAELVIKYNDTRTSLEFYLRSKSEEIELEKTKVKIYKRTK